MTISDITLDTSGLHCPLPVLKAKKKIKEMKSGDILTLIATDPASRIDIDHFCHISQNDLLSASEENGIFTYQIKVS